MIIKTQSYDLPIYGCAVRRLPDYSKCVYIPGYFGVNFFGAKCVTYNVDSNCMCIGDGTQCYPSSNCVLQEEECFWDWRGGREECLKINGPANRLKCSRNEWLSPLNDPGECILRKTRQPKCKVKITPIYYPPYEDYQCVTERYVANCTYVSYTSGSFECVPAENIVKIRDRCDGCFRDKEDMLNRCEKDGVPTNDVYVCSDNQDNVISDVIQEEKENITEGISQRNWDECNIVASSGKTFDFYLLNVIGLMMILI